MSRLSKSQLRWGAESLLPGGLHGSGHAHWASCYQLLLWQLRGLLMGFVLVVAADDGTRGQSSVCHEVICWQCVTSALQQAV